MKSNRARESRGAEWQLAQRVSFINGSRQSAPFCPEFPKQHEKNLTEPPEKKKRHSGRKKLKWFKCPKTQTEYTELIDNTWAAERTHVSVAGWGNVTHFKRSTRSSDEVVTALCDPSGPKLFCPRHSLNRNISIDLYFRTFFNLHTQKARVGGGNVKKKQPSLYQEAERMVGKVKCLQLKTSAQHLQAHWGQFPDELMASETGYFWQEVHNNLVFQAKTCFFSWPSGCCAWT